MDNNIDNFTEEELKEAENLTADLVERAKAGKHSDFIYIRAWEERVAVKAYYRSSKEVATQFFNMWKKLMKDYLKNLKNNFSRLELLLAAKDCNEIAEFYYKEAEIAKDICKEYRSYVMGGHMIDTLLGNYRTEDDLVDFRTLPTKWF